MLTDSEQTAVSSIKVQCPHHLTFFFAAVMIAKAAGGDFVIKL